MSKNNKTDVLFIQPGYAHYRDRLFSILSNRHDIHFVFEHTLSVYPGAIRPVGIPYTFLDHKYRISSVGLVYHLLKHRPNIVISSVSSSFRSVVSFLYTIFFRKRFILWILEFRKQRPSSHLLKHLWRLSKNLIGIMLIRHSHSLVVGGSAAKRHALSLGKDENDIFMAMQCSNDLKQQQGMKYKKMKCHTKKCTFLYMSRIIPYKGLDILLKAFSLLRNKRADVYLLIGGDGPFLKYCQQLAKTLVIKNVSFVGAVNPVSVFDLYQQADVFVLPSYYRKNRYEVWGLVINEAMSMSLPIITTKAVGAAYDLVIEGYNGCIVEDNDVMNLYKAMERIINLDFVQMGLNSRSLFEKKNDFIRMADGFSLAIEHAISK